MKQWNKRSNEIAFLLNPAFCGRLLYSTINKYNQETNRPFPIVLTYLVLPLLLHKRSRDAIDSRTQMLIWIQRNESLLVNFSERAKQLVPVTNEAIEMLLQSNCIHLTSAADLEVNPMIRALSKTRFTDIEVKDCLSKGEHLARWFARAGKAETIYIALGVRP